MRDVAIAGGGPAGCACAAFLARGCDVTVFENHSKVGEPVQCAGLVTDETLRMSGVSPGILSVLYGAEVFMPDGNVLTVRSSKPKAKAVDRSEFDSLMADRAVAAGAELRTGERVESFSVSSCAEVRTSAGSEDYRILVGADGYSSGVAKAIGAGGKISYLRGIQANVRMRADSPDLFRIRLGSRYAPGFFAWEIPCGDIVRVGLCVPWEEGPPHPYLRRLLSDFGYESRTESLNCGIVPVGTGRKLVSDRVMLAGDAAVQVKPVSAGGLHPALTAAPMLAETALSALESGDCSARGLSGYEKKWNSGPGAELKSAARLRKLYLKMDDSALNRAGKFAERDDVRRYLDEIDLDSPQNVIRAMAKHPLVGARGLCVLARCLL